MNNTVDTPCGSVVLSPKAKRVLSVAAIFIVCVAFALSEAAIYSLGRYHPLSEDEVCPTIELGPNATSFVLEKQMCVGAVCDSL